jgi:hypothetical protein
MPEMSGDGLTRCALETHLETRGAKAVNTLRSHLKGSRLPAEMRVELERDDEVRT